MGNLFSLCKDLRKQIYLFYLDREDRKFLWYAVGVKPRLNTFLMVSVIQKRQINLVKWLWDQKCPAGIYATSFASLEGQFEMLQWLKARGCKWNSQVCTYAAMKGQKEILQWAIENGCEYDEWTAFHSRRNGFLDFFIEITTKHPNKKRKKTYGILPPDEDTYL